ncbi:hypothetical protein ABZ260_51035, partial [Streptosporangium sp. NPDC006013]
MIVPDTIVIDGGKVFVSETFTRACARLGISAQNCRPGTPTDKGIVEVTFDAINTLFCQHAAAYTSSNTQLRGDRVDAQTAWTVPDLQDLLDEWLLAGWQSRPHDALRDPYFPRRAISPNDKYAALVAARSLHTGTAEQMEHEALSNLQAELFQVRVALNQLRAEVARH